MLDGWFCRTLANEQSGTQPPQQNHSGDLNDDQMDDDSGTDESQDGIHDNFNNPVDYKAQYRYLKRKLKFLIYVSSIPIKF